MKFDEETAARIAEKNGLKKQNINKWRFNGEIPDRYFPQKADRKDLAEVVSMRRILKSDKINITALCELAGVRRLFVEKFLVEKYTLSEDETLALKKELSGMKIKVKQIISYLEKLPNRGAMDEKEVKRIIKEKTFFVKNVCEDPLIAIKINEWVRGKRDMFPLDAKNTFLAGLLTFSIEL